MTCLIKSVMPKLWTCCTIWKQKW